jgi:hypothetical protein
MVDAMWTTIGGVLAYTYHLRQAKKSGLSEAEAKKVALEQLDLTIGRTAQPASNMDRSLTEIQLDANAIGRVYMMFKSEPRQKIAAAIMGIRDMIKSPGHRMIGAQATFVSMFLMPMVTHIMSEWFASVFRDKDEEDLWEPKDFMHAVATGQSSGLFFIGDAIEFLSATAFDQRVFKDADQITDSVSGLTRMMNETLKGDFGRDGEEYTAQEISKDFNSGARALSLLLGGRFAALGVSSRVVKDAANFQDWITENLQPASISELDDKLSELEKNQDELDEIKDAAKEEVDTPELSKQFKRLKGLRVGTLKEPGLRVQGVKAVIEATPTADRASLISALKDAKILSTTVQKQLDNLQ